LGWPSIRAQAFACLLTTRVSWLTLLFGTSFRMSGADTLFGHGLFVAPGRPNWGREFMALGSTPTVPDPLATTPSSAPAPPGLAPCRSGSRRRHSVMASRGFNLPLPLVRLVRTEICGLYLCICFADLRCGAVMHVFFISFFEIQFF